ncbi:MAG TPA: cytochrome c3 family protein, partial [Candidatus Methanoperedens sp.]|nr:cytochrome c3 family protein [Candidatus Methanoperedens sp.]
MDSGRHFAKFAAGLSYLAAGLLCVFPAAAQASQGELQAEPLHEARQHDLAAMHERKHTVGAVENAAICGKCHSSCEQGRTHGGRGVAAQQGGIELPLTADGRATCLTCHKPHSDGTTTAAARLRIPNLRRELCLACHAPAAAVAPGIEIVSPPERALVLEERLALIGRLSGRVGGHLTVRLNDATFHVQARERDFFTWLLLREGVNRCEIALGEQVLWRGEIFRGESSASGYARSTFGHHTGSQQECLGCHDGGDGRVAEATERTSALCYGCHQRFDGKRYLHGPLGVGACLACHDPHSGYGTAHLREEQALLCGKCHAEREIAAKSGCATSGKKCAECHDPHQSDSRYLLKGPEYTLL